MGRDGHDPKFTMYKKGQDVMNTKHFILVSAIALSAAYSASTLAGESELFKQLDSDGDGAVSAVEAAADPKLAAEWDMLDANKDGKLEQIEFSAFEEKVKKVETK